MARDEKDVVSREKREKEWMCILISGNSFLLSFLLRLASTLLLLLDRLTPLTGELKCSEESEGEK